MKKRLAIFTYSLAEKIKRPWSGFNKYVDANCLISLVLTLNLLAFKIAILGRWYNKGQAVQVGSDIVFFIVTTLVLCKVFNRSYMERLEYDAKQLRLARILLFIYLILSVVFLITVKTRSDD
jgi:hypothetical protein